GRLEELQEHVASLKSEWRAAGKAGKLGEPLRNLERELEQLAREMVADSRQLNHACRAVDDEVHRIRMLPFVEGGVGLERAVRDLARSTGKEVSLVIEGGEIELDRAVLE